MNLAQIIAHGFGKLTGSQRSAGATNVLAVDSATNIIYPDGSIGTIATTIIAEDPSYQKLNEGINYATDLAGHAAQDSTSASANVVNILGAVQYAIDIAGKASSPIALPADTKTGTSTGNLGNIAYDSSYMYICTAKNVWKRISLTAF